MNLSAQSVRILLLLNWAGPVAAQELVIPDVTYPTLPAAAAGAEGFAPAGWQVEARARGDLNADGTSDIAFVLRNRDPANILENEGLGEAAFDTNPRILAVAFGRPGGRGYRLILQDHRLIPRRDSPVLQDPFDPDEASMTVEDGKLKLSLVRFASAGGWNMGSTSFTFRWQDGAMRLIGYDYDSVHRASGELAELSINFLTRRAKVTTGNVGVDRQQVRWTRIGPQPLPALEEVGDGLAFDPQGLVSALP